MRDGGVRKAMLRILGLLLILDQVWTHGPGLGLDSVFLSRPEAQQVLVRLKRANSFLEEMKMGDLQRECVEEICDYEEAREIFESTQLTDEFWAKYVDGDACESGPCENGGICRDTVGGFSCLCLAGYKGDQCQTVIPVLCEDDNGGCQHFCEVKTIAEVRFVRCSCADGYFLSHDQLSCASTEPFKCGVLISERSSVGPRTNLHNYNQTLNMTRDQTETLLDLPGPNRTSIVHNPDHSPDHSPDQSPDQSPVLSLDIMNSSVIPQPQTEQIQLDPGLDSDHGLDSDYGVDLGMESPDLENIRSEMSSNLAIMNEYNCPPGECPWQALLLDENHRGFCGGTILNDIIVLTAAHCMNQSQNIFVLLGEFDRRVKHGNEAVHLVESVLIHSSYRPENHHNDIALIKLKKPIVFSRDVLPACLPSKDLAQKVLMSAQSGLISGFSRSPLLQRLGVPFVDRARCVESTPFSVSTRMFCAGYEEGGEAECVGDWGGPHLTRYRETYFITGIATWDQGCGRKGQYGLYTQVSKYLLWIREGMKVLVSPNPAQDQDQRQPKRKRRSRSQTQQAVGPDQDSTKTKRRQLELNPDLRLRGFQVFYL